MRIRPATSAFSLVELAIVLAIIGLLAGGVTVGISLLQRVKVNAAMNEITKYRNAFSRFREVYQALPGDYADATEVWGVDASGCTTRTPKKETCNGNGNNFINGGGETFRVWQHLSNAGLVDGSFTGAADSAGGYTPAENMAPGPFEDSGYFIDTAGAVTSDPTYFDQTSQPEMLYGKRAVGGWPSLPVFTSKEQYNIDQKADDGRPATGYMRSLKGSCATTANASAEYNLSMAGAVCTLQVFMKPI